jgi:hypothetical protein
VNRYGLFILCFWMLILGVIVGAYAQQYNDQHADITVLPCSAWADNQNPVIPPYTFTGACALPDGTLSVPDLGQLGTK